MLSTRLLLRVVLALLAVAALVGAGGVLFARTPVVYRIDGSLVLTAVCCSLLMITRRFAENPAGRRAAGLYIALVAAEFILGMAMVWDVASFDSGWGEQALETLGAIAGAGLPAVAFLRLDGNSRARAAARFGLLLCVAVFVLWIIGSWRDAGPTDDFRWFTYGWTTGGIGLLIAGALVGVGSDRRYWRWIGVASAIAAGVVLLHAVEGAAVHAEPLGIFVALAFSVAHANLAVQCPLRANQRWLAFTTIAAVGLTALFVNLGLLRPDRNWAYSGVDRLAASSGILAACGSLALAILMRINQRSQWFESLPKEGLRLSPIAVVCPVCGNRLSVTNGSAGCAGCGLVVHARAEEPRCAACGYSLLMCKSDRCPECGGSVVQPPSRASFEGSP